MFILLVVALRVLIFITIFLYLSLNMAAKVSDTHHRFLLR
jgi:hypothetical protein